MIDYKGYLAVAAWVAVDRVHWAHDAINLARNKPLRAAFLVIAPAYKDIVWC